MLVSELEPKKVFKYFEEISAIPHGSGNTDKIAQYCEDFAKKQGLKSVRDKYNNVVIFAPGTSGYENSEPVIIQGHIDMVCEKKADLNLNMEKESITLLTDGKKVWADGTTLGGDDGIAVAYIMALLASEDIPHPPIEAVLTSDEETGMFGARGLDMSLLKSTRLINIDSEEEGFVCVSCAGGVRACCRIPVIRQKTEKSDVVAYNISIKGLQGGHSGVEIHKNRENAFILLGSMLSRLLNTTQLTLADIEGGGKDNVIPKQAKVCICVPTEKSDLLEKEYGECRRMMLEELSLNEPDICIELEKATVPADCLNSECTAKLIYAMQFIPNGVQRMNPEIDELTQTSLNLGIINIHRSHLTFRTLIRSNSVSGKQLMFDKVAAFVGFLGGECTAESEYPAWEYKIDSPLREVMISEYEKQYGEKPVITAIHAGLECGIFAGKKPELDMVSIGPDLTDVHTPNEAMDVASVDRTWTYLKNVLGALK